MFSYERIDSMGRDMISTVKEKMVEYYSGDSRRVHHFLKVNSFAKLIGECESLPEYELEILEIAALVHDIGIKKAEMKYGYNNGSLQEKEGPPEAKSLLKNIGAGEDLTERVCYLVGHHHTYRDIQGMDYQILVEADFLVNLYEDRADRDTIIKVYGNIFRTESGKRLCRQLFPVVS